MSTIKPTTLSVCNAQIPAGPVGLGSSSPLLLAPPRGVAAAIMPNLANVVSQSYRKPNVLFSYKTKQFIGNVVKLQVYCTTLLETY